VDKYNRYKTLFRLFPELLHCRTVSHLRIPELHCLNAFIYGGTALNKTTVLRRSTIKLTGQFCIFVRMCPLKTKYFQTVLAGNIGLVPPSIACA
jgi:hypothetical protein